MSDHNKIKSKKHKVIHNFSGKNHWFTVESASGKVYEVSIAVACGCQYMGIQGVANGKICSHILAALNAIIDAGNIPTGQMTSEQIVSEKRST